MFQVPGVYPLKHGISVGSYGGWVVFHPITYCNQPRGHQDVLPRDPSPGHWLCCTVSQLPRGSVVECAGNCWTDGVDDWVVATQSFF